MRLTYQAYGLIFIGRKSAGAALWQRETIEVQGNNREGED